MSAPKNQLISVELSEIRAAASNPFASDVIDNQKMSELTNSIKRNGLHSPICIRSIEDGPYKFEVITGSRRFYALKKLGIKSTDCILRELEDDDEQFDADLLEEQIDENVHKRDCLNPLELGMAYKQLITLRNIEQKEFAEESGVSERKISQLISLTDLHESFKESIMIRMTEDGEELPMYPLSFLVQVRKRQNAVNEHKSAKMALSEAILFFNSSRDHIENDPRIIDTDLTARKKINPIFGSFDVSLNSSYFSIEVTHNSKERKVESLEDAQRQPFKITCPHKVDPKQLSGMLIKLADSIRQESKTSAPNLSTSA